MNAPVMRTVVVVDDNDDVCSSLALLLKTMGWDACTFASGRACLDAVCSGLHPDCFLIDLNMPGMTGPEVIETLARQFGQVAAVMMTGEADSPLVEFALAAGAYQVLLKPFDPDQLEGALQSSMAQLH